MNGPSNAGLYNYAGNPPPWLKPSPVTFKGYCLPCDTQFRCQKVQDQVNARGIKQVCANWNQRWKSPKVIEFGEDDRAVLKKIAV